MRLTLKSIVPRGLFGRAALILIVPVISIQLIVSVAFIQRHYAGVTKLMSHSIALEIGYLLQEIDQSGSLDEAQARVKPIAQALEITLVLPVAAAKIPAQDEIGTFDLSGHEVITSLRAKLSSTLALSLIDDESGQFKIFLQTKHGPVSMTLSRKRVSASNPHQLLVLMVFTAILMTLIAYVFLRNQLFPITRLAKAAEAFGRGETVAYRPRGALEVRAAGAAFLDMRARIERQIESRTLLLSGVSHDLRGPLQRLKLGLTLLPEDAETEALKQDVSDMERLVDEFLAFVRGDAMEEPEWVDPHDIARRVVANAARLGQSVSLWDLEPVGLVKLRAQAVTRALDNLVGNAVRYGTKTEISVASNDRFVRMIVEDNGPGIPESAREEAMVPFKRLDAARDPNQGGGVGLGLSIAADIARSHGGALRLGRSDRLNGLRAELTLRR
ncbi:MAG: ATP-binding protein [Microgenomates group bacterium]